MNPKILILCSRLDLPGGTERAITNMANMFATKSLKVTIVILDVTSSSYYQLNNQIQILSKPLHFGITPAGNMLTRKYAFAKHIFQLKKIIKQIKPDVIISTDYPYSIALVLGRINRYSKLISWEHHHFYWLKRNRFWNWLHKKIYPQLSAVVTLNTTEQQLFSDYGCNALIIPNFVKQKAKSLEGNLVILSVGWLNWRKGVDLIPFVAEKVFEKYPAWKWNVIGTGEQKTEFEKSLFEKKLNRNVEIIKPISSDISEQYKQAAIYVMTSRFECFPMVLLEAMSFGVPCISFDCPTGPSDIIQDGIDGKLIEQENISAMANAIIDLIENEEKRKKMGAKAFENIKRFSPEKVYELWEKLLNA